MSDSVVQPSWSEQWFSKHPPTPAEDRAREASRSVAQVIAWQPETRYSGIGSSQPNTALLLNQSLGWADICARAIANRVASLDFEIVRRTVTRGKAQEIVDDAHPLKELLDSPSQLHTRRAMLRLIGQHLVTVGDAMLLKVRGPGFAVGDIGELQVMMPQRVTPISVGGRVAAFRVIDGNGLQSVIKAEDIVRIWLADPETLLTGEGYLGPQATMADVSRFGGETVRTKLEFNAIPDVVLQAGDSAQPFLPDELERFNTTWRQGYHRLLGRNRGLPAMLPVGWTAQVLESKTGSEMVALLEFAKAQILMAYGVPGSILGFTDQAGLGRATAETNQYVFDLHTVTPIADTIADALTYQLARPIFGPDILIRFKPFVQSDKDFDLRREAHDLAMKVRAVDEVRIDRGLDRSTWGELPVGTFAEAPYTGDVAGAPLAMDNVAALGGTPRRRGHGPAGDAAPAAGGGGRGSPAELEWTRVLIRERQFVPKFDLVVRRIFRAQQRDLQKQIDSAGLGRSHARDLTEAEVLDLVVRALAPKRWAELFKRQTDPIRKSATLTSGQQALDLINADVKSFAFTPRVVSILQAQTESFAARVSNTTLQVLADKVTTALAAGAAAGESASERAKRIEGAVGDGFDIRRSHATTIARTEMLKATQQAQTEGYRQSGVIEQKQWNTSRDDAVRDSHQIDGQVVVLDDMFTLGDGAQASQPGDESLPAEDVINCRCFVTPVLEAP